MGSSTIAEAVQAIHAAATNNWQGAGAMLQTGRLVRELAQRLRKSMAVFSLAKSPAAETKSTSERR